MTRLTDGGIVVRPLSAHDVPRYLAHPPDDKMRRWLPIAERADEQIPRGSLPPGRGRLADRLHGGGSPSTMRPTVTCSGRSQSASTGR
jgi:hypothetical protein